MSLAEAGEQKYKEFVDFETQSHRGKKGEFF